MQVSVFSDCWYSNFTMIQVLMVYGRFPEKGGIIGFPYRKFFRQ
jgi:hypothetical protein